jgi:hypothetical protein
MAKLKLHILGYELSDYLALGLIIYDDHLSIIINPYDKDGAVIREFEMRRLFPEVALCDIR